MTPAVENFLLSGGWALSALISASFSGGFYLINQYMKQSGLLLVFWMRVVVVAFLLPFVFFIKLPVDLSFYGLVIATGLLGVAADIRALDVSRKYGAGISSRTMPVTVWASFLLWFFFDPALLMTYLHEPFRLCGILLALSMCVYFAMRVKRCTVSKSALIDMTPALMAYTMTTLLNKMALQDGIVGGQFSGAIFAYMFVQSIVGVFMTGGYLVFKERRNFGQPAGWGRPITLIAGAMAGFVWVSLMVFKNYAVAYTPHPSYQAAIGLTAPVFIMLFYKATGHRETEDVWAGMGIVASALLLVLMTI